MLKVRRLSEALQDMLKLRGLKSAEAARVTKWAAGLRWELSVFGFMEINYGLVAMVST